jgi:hypothetical protein
MPAGTSGRGLHEACLTELHAEMLEAAKSRLLSDDVVKQKVAAFYAPVRNNPPGAPS